MEAVTSRPPQASIRRMGPDDVDAVVAIEAASFSSPWRPDTFRSLLERPTVELWVLEMAGEGVIGYAVLWCVLDQGELANIAIADAFRRRGLGRRLLEHVMAVARERGVETLVLEVRVSNRAAAALYERYGFVEVGYRKDYYDQPREDARVMLARL